MYLSIWLGSSELPLPSTRPAREQTDTLALSGVMEKSEFLEAEFDLLC